VSGSVLIIVLWVAFGLVSLALYFAHSMSLELRAADNRCAAIEADQAIAGAARYASNILAYLEQPGVLPDTRSYAKEAVTVGDATFWFLGRGDEDDSPERPVFGLVDEASKLNLNTATADMLQNLPRMTTEFAAAIVDWRDADSDVTPGGAETETYMRRQPAYRCKNASFESIDELRLVAGATLEILFGEDANLNGVLDPNENDGDLSPPPDDRNGRLDPGILEYVTVYSRESNTRTNGSPRINVTSTNQVQLASLLRERLGTERANQILARFGRGSGQVNSLLGFYLQSGMTEDEFALVETDLTVTDGNTRAGLVNVNTASETVLACLPGIGPDGAASLVAFRRSHDTRGLSVAWVAGVLDRQSAIQAGPYLTTRSYQVSADVAAVGHHGRGFRRARHVFDATAGTPKMIFRQDLTGRGWALGPDVLRDRLLARYSR
jgi:DNA uptake protein ComE-like DNA-binding protein